MAQQTAVEWLFAQIPLEFSSSRAAYEKLEQAMQMEKEQIIQAFDIACEDKDRIGREYYEETYKKTVI